MVRTRRLSTNRLNFTALVALAGGTDLYSQWFERLGASPGTVLVAGLLAIGFAFGIRTANHIMKEKQRRFEDDWPDLTG